MVKVALLHFCFEDYTVELANGLAKHTELILIHPEQLSPRHQKKLDPTIQTISFWKPRIRDLRNLLTLRQIMRILHELQPDVLHVQETNNFWYDLTLPFRRLPPLVTTIHDVFRHPGDRDLRFGTEYSRRISYYCSKHLIVHTQMMKEVLVKQFHVPQRRISVLPHGELGNLYQNFAGSLKTPMREPYTLLFFGRIWPYKGLKYLLEAMSLVAQQIPQVKLIIAGRGENLEQYFPDGCDSDRYEILNEFIPFEAVAGLFQRSSAVILPYVESSQSGVATIAYSLGTPVIASDIGGLGEMIHHGEDGLLVPPGDVPALANAIIQLLHDRALHQQIQLSALKRCRKDLDWVNIAGETARVYHHLIGSTRFH